MLQNPTTHLKMDNESVRKMKTHSGDIRLRFIYRRIDVECVMAPQDDMEKVTCHFLNLEIKKTHITFYWV
jgi:hypothetical protein